MGGRSQRILHEELGGRYHINRTSTLYQSLASAMESAQSCLCQDRSNSFIYTTVSPVYRAFGQGRLMISEDE